MPAPMPAGWSDPRLRPAAREGVLFTAPAAGRPFADTLRATRGGQVDPGRDHVLIGKERYDLGRPGDAGYHPIRATHKGGWLYLRNYEPGRWPAANPETGYLNTADPAHAARKAARRAQLERELTAQGDPRVLGHGDVFDRYEDDNPGRRHFYERFMRGDRPQAPWVAATDYERSPIPD